MAAIELITFRLADGADESSFLAADEAVRTGFLYQQPGIVRSTTARADDGEWLLSVLWWSQEAADAAAAKAEDDPTCASLWRHVDRSTFTRRCYSDLDG